MLLLCWTLATLGAQQVALSLDDAPFLSAAAPRLEAAAQHQAMLAALKARQVQAILFVNGIGGGDTPQGQSILKAWGEAGHLLGNHTYSHWDLNRPEVALEDYQADILKGEAVIRDLPGFTRLFRYPYLRAGQTEARRDAVYAFLKARGYGLGHVTIDTADWLLDERLRRRLAREPAADLAPYRDLYLRHLWACARFYDAWTRETVGRPVPHVLLLHSRLLNGLFLGEVVDFFRSKGWTWISPAQAFKDPALQLWPRSLPAGEALADALGAEQGRTGFPRAWREKSKDPDDLLFAERRLAERLDQAGL